MMTRRTVVSNGLALVSAACAASFGKFEATAGQSRQARSIDALLIDESIEMPAKMAAFVEVSRRTTPIVGVQLDAATYAELMRVLDKSRTIVGISSGATLFCLERLAWDHGFRLTQRVQRSAGDACLQDVNAFLSGAHPYAASPSPLASAYRPSRADGSLHAWVMQKSAGPKIRQGRREV